MWFQMDKKHFWGFPFVLCRWVQVQISKIQIQYSGASYCCFSPSLSQTDNVRLLGKEQKHRPNWKGESSRWLPQWQMIHWEFNCGNSWRTGRSPVKRVVVISVNHVYELRGCPVYSHALLVNSEKERKKVWSILPKDTTTIWTLWL